MNNSLMIESSISENYFLNTYAEDSYFEINQIKQKISVLKKEKQSMTNIKDISLIREEIWQNNVLLYKELLKISDKSPSLKKLGGGTSGCYLLSFDTLEKMKGIFKPYDESADTRAGIPQEEETIRERLGFVVSQFLNSKLTDSSELGIKNFGVPPTLVVSFDECEVFEKTTIGSYQKFKAGTPLQDLSQSELNDIPINEYMKMFLLDVILLNTDRHLGNVFLSKKNTLTLIDQGSTLPEKASLNKNHAFDTISFDWMYLPFTEQPIPVEWKEFILNISIEELYQTLIQEMKNLNSLDLECPTAIRANAFFNSIGSLYFLQHWIRSSNSLSIRDFVRCLCQERVAYLYTVDKETKQINRLIKQPINTPPVVLSDYAAQLDNDYESGCYGNYTSKAIFIDFIKKSWETFSKDIAKEQTTNQANTRKKIAHKPPQITVESIFSKLELVCETFKKELQNINFKSTEDLAKEQFSK